MPAYTGQNPEAYDKMDSKGYAGEKDCIVCLGRVDSAPDRSRDNCRLVSTVIETCLHKMLIDRNVKGRWREVDREFFQAALTLLSATQQIISDLLQNKVTCTVGHHESTGKSRYVDTSFSSLSGVERR